LYQRILVALDGSKCSDLAMQAALALADRGKQTLLIGCHVYAARMHRVRFEEMEPGLPEKYQEEERLDYLRHTHDNIITEGMQLISDAYLAPLVREAQKKELALEGLTPEGRNYVELLRAVGEQHADLVVLGAWGHGHVPEGSLGSLTERILLYAQESDILMLRRPWNFKDRPIVVGIDGSENSYAALKRAAELAKVFDARVEAVAVYDPFFHTGVFRIVAEALPEEASERFNFPAQEKLHDEIIDRGLETLYREGLERGVLLARSLGVEVHPEVVAGKVYPQIHHYAALREAGLVVMGRWGLHREPESLIGSNTLNLARLSTANLLVVAPPEEPLEVPESPREEAVSLHWTPEAEAVLERVPSFVRRMARKAVEDHVREKGFTEVTPEAVREAGQLFGMGGVRRAGDTAKAPEAQVVVLRKVKRLAPGFHRHILRGKIRGQTVRAGDSILVYEVVETVPPGPVRVTERTHLEFR
jgi:nucleotide-binding universal stress UspA family protein